MKKHVDSELIKTIQKQLLSLMEKTGLTEEIVERKSVWQTTLHSGWSFSGQRKYAKAVASIFQKTFGSSDSYTADELAVRLVYCILCLEVFKTQMAKSGMIPPLICTYRALRRVLHAYDEQKRKATTEGLPDYVFIYNLTFKAIAEFFRLPAKAEKNHREELLEFWGLRDVRLVPFNPSRLSHNGYETARRKHSEVLLNEC